MDIERIGALRDWDGMGARPQGGSIPSDLSCAKTIPGEGRGSRTPGALKSATQSSVASRRSLKQGLSVVVAARQLGHTVLAERHQLWLGGVVEWKDGLGRAVGSWRGAVSAVESFALVTHPMRQERLRVIVDPLVEQSGNLPAQVGGTI